jgi:DNA-binding NtrC family response regulator
MSSFYTNPTPVRPLLLRASANAAGDADASGTASLALECRLRALRMLVVTLLRQLESMESHSAEANDLQVDSLVDEFEAQLIQSALVLTSGHQRRAARILGLKANTLNNKMRRHDLPAQL